MTTLSTTDLVALAHHHDGVKTLSAYISVPKDSSDRFEHARIALGNGIDAARAALGDVTHVERIEFEACAARTLAAIGKDPARLPGSTWISFAIVNDSHYVWSVPAPLPTGIEDQVVWDDGLRVGPYFTLPVSAGALVVLVDREHAAFFAVNGDVTAHPLHRFETVPNIATGSHVSHMSAPPKTSFHQGTHGTPAADVAARQATSAYERHRKRVVETIGELSKTPRILLGGSAEAVAHVMAALPAAVRANATAVRALRVNATNTEIASITAAAADQERVGAEQALVDSALGRARSTPLGVLGEGPVQIAVAQRAVDTLVVSVDMLAKDATTFERVVRNAMRQHARVQVVHGLAAEQLNTAAAGIAARLRFPIAAPAA